MPSADAFTKVEASTTLWAVPEKSHSWAVRAALAVMKHTHEAAVTHSVYTFTDAPKTDAPKNVNTTH